MKKREKHGHSTNGRRTPEYAAWLGIIHRCTRPSCKFYPRYGGRGIGVCEEWEKSFVAFYQHIGPRPSERHSIDRIDVNGGYEPGNVRWATASEQQNNRRDNIRLVYQGKICKCSARSLRMPRNGWSALLAGMIQPRQQIVFEGVKP